MVLKKIFPLICILGILLTAACKHDHDPKPQPQDTVSTDTLPVDTLPVDTLPVDTLPVDTLDSIPATARLMGCYSFSGNALDASGNNNHGTINGAVLTTDRFGNANSAFAFDGTGYIELPIDSFLNDTYTYSLWANLSIDPDYEEVYNIFSIGQTSYNDTVGRPHQVLNSANFYASAGATGWNAGGFNLTDPLTASSQTGVVSEKNTWVHLASVRTDSSITLYVNGVAFPSYFIGAAKPNYGIDTKAIIGMRSNFTQPFHGSIDDVSIFRGALTAEQVNKLFTDGISCSGSTPP